MSQVVVCSAMDSLGVIRKRGRDVYQQPWGSGRFPVL